MDFILADVDISVGIVLIVKVHQRFFISNELLNICNMTHILGHTGTYAEPILETTINIINEHKQYNKYIKYLHEHVKQYPNAYFINMEKEYIYVKNDDMYKYMEIQDIYEDDYDY